MQKSFAKVNSLSGINMFQPQVTRSYNELHFRLLIPEVQEYADRIELSTKFMYKETERMLILYLKKQYIQIV